MQTTPSAQIVKLGDSNVVGSAFTLIKGPRTIESREPFLATFEFFRQSGRGSLKNRIWQVRSSAQIFQSLEQDSISFSQNVSNAARMQLNSEKSDTDQMQKFQDVLSPSSLHQKKVVHIVF